MMVEGRRWSVEYYAEGVALSVEQDGRSYSTTLNYQEARVVAAALLRAADLVERSVPSAVPRETIRSLWKAFKAGQVDQDELEVALELLSGGEE